MRIKSIKFKVTTSQDKCHFCKKRLIGEDGFIHIIVEKDKGMFPDWLVNMRVCWKCVIRLLGEFLDDRKGRKEKYLELTKKAIVRNLK